MDHQPPCGACCLIFAAFQGDADRAESERRRLGGMLTPRSAVVDGLLVGQERVHVLGDDVAQPGELGCHPGSRTGAEGLGHESDLECRVLAVLPALRPAATCEVAAQSRRRLRLQLVARTLQPRISRRDLARARKPCKRKSSEVAPIVVGNWTITKVPLFAVPIEPLAEALANARFELTVHAWSVAQPVVAERRVGSEGADSVP